MKRKECTLVNHFICPHNELTSEKCSVCALPEKKCICGNNPLIYSALATRCLRCGYLIK